MMKTRNGILTGLIAACAACVISAASCSQSPQISNKPMMETPMVTVSFAVDAPVRGITAGRARSLVGGVVSLISLVIGGLALVRNGRAGAIVALVLGLIGIVLSVVHLGGSTGGFGTGSGRAGAIVALVLGLIGTNLGGLALARARRRRSID